MTGADDRSPRHREDDEVTGSCEYRRRGGVVAGRPPRTAGDPMQRLHAPPLQRALALALLFGAASVARSGVEAPDGAQSAQPPARPTPSAVADAERRDREGELRRRFLPEPMAPDRLGRLPAELDLDEEARALYPRVVERYEAAWRELQGEDARQIAVRLPAAFRFDHASGDFDEVHTPEYLDLLRLRDRLMARIETVEETFVREVVALAGPEGAAAARAFRLARTRELHARPARLPAAAIDLVDLLSRAGIPGTELEPLDLALGQYAERLIEATRVRHRTLADLDREEAEYRVALGPEWRAARDAEEILSIERDLAQLAVAAVLADMPIRDLNQRSIEQFRRALVPESGRRAIDAYQRLVHPALFEDERAFQALLEEFVALPSGTPEQATAAVDIARSLEDRLRGPGQQAVELADAVITASQLPPTDATAARILLEAKIEGVLARRRGAVRDGVRQLQVILSGEQATFARRLEDALATLAAQDRAGAFLQASLEERARELAVIEAIAREAATRPADALPPPETQPAGSEPTEPEAAPPEERPERPSRGSRRGR